MPPSDSSLKLLILSFQQAFAEWLLKRPVRRVHPYSVVIYLGNGAGTGDIGQYELLGLDGKPSLSWRYQPLLLWQMEAKELLALDQPAFLPLVGQTRLDEPRQVLPEVIERLRQVSDLEQRGRLLTALTSLISNEEVLTMVEQMIDTMDELWDTPYLRRVRQQGREEGLVEGKEEGLVEGLIRGKEEGLLAGLREAILETITVRFDPVASEYRRVSHQLDELTNREQLQQVLVAAIQATDMAAFTTRLAEIVPAE